MYIHVEYQKCAYTERWRDRSCCSCMLKFQWWLTLVVLTIVWHMCYDSVCLVNFTCNYILYNVCHAHYVLYNAERMFYWPKLIVTKTSCFYFQRITVMLMMAVVVAVKGVMWSLWSWGFTSRKHGDGALILTLYHHFPYIRYMLAISFA